MRICRKYHLIVQNIMKIIIIWYTVVGISGSDMCGFVVCVVVSLNRIKINRFF